VLVQAILDTNRSAVVFNRRHIGESSRPLLVNGRKMEPGMKSRTMTDTALLRPKSGYSYTPLCSQSVDGLEHDHHITPGNYAVLLTLPMAMCQVVPVLKDMFPVRVPSSVGF